MAPHTAVAEVVHELKEHPDSSWRKKGKLADEGDCPPPSLVKNALSVPFCPKNKYQRHGTRSKRLLNLEAGHWSASCSDSGLDVSSRVGWLRTGHPGLGEGQSHPQSCYKPTAGGLRYNVLVRTAGTGIVTTPGSRSHSAWYRPCNLGQAFNLSVLGYVGIITVPSSEGGCE